MVVDQLELVDHLAPCHPAGGGAAAVRHLEVGVDQAALLVEEQLGRLQPPGLALVEFEQVSWQLPATISIIRLQSKLTKIESWHDMCHGFLSKGCYLLQSRIISVVRQKRVVR